MRPTVTATTPAPRVFRYIVRWDGGTAPCPFDGALTLAICKPKIRATAQVGHWVIGFRRHQAGEAIHAMRTREVIYAMKVTERLSFSDYWTDARFTSRRPGATPFPDNIYRPGLTRGTWRQEPNHVHSADAMTRDISGKFVLISDCFWYFGDQSVPIPNELLHLVHDSRGHSVNKNARLDDSAQIEAWLAAWPSRGVLGRPIDEAKTRANFDRWRESMGHTRKTCG